jgi:hypothetical protein
MQARQRTYTLIVGRPVYLGEKATNIERLTKAQRGTDSFKITDLHMEFEVKKDNSKEPNKGYITIFNLSDDVVNYLDANQRESLAVLLHAGYDGDEKLIFSGTVEFLEDKFDDETRTTKLILGDGTLNLKTAQTSRSYRKGTRLDAVLGDLITDLKLPKGRVIDFGNNQTLQHSMAFTGTASQNLANLAQNTGSTFSVQDGAVYWTREGSRFASTMFEISEDGGMIGVPSPKNPEKGKKGLKKTKKSAAKTEDTATSKSVEAKAKVKEDAGMTVSTLLNGAILPESTVYLNTKKYKGFYKVVTLKHKGGYESGDWITELGLAETRGVLIK